MEKPRKKKLLDCPFCGHDAVTKIEQPRMDSENLPKYCKCSHGPCCASKIYWPIEQWNIRAMSAWIEGQLPSVESIAVIIDPIGGNNSMKAMIKAEEIHSLITRKLKGEG